MAWTLIATRPAITYTNSKCVFALYYQITGTNNVTGQYTIQLKPVVLATTTLFINLAGSSTTLYAGTTNVSSQTYSPKSTWSTEQNTVTTAFGEKTYTHAGYLLDNTGNATPSVTVQGTLGQSLKIKLYYTYAKGSNTSYAPRYEANGSTAFPSSVEIGGEVTLPAITPATYTVSYNANGGSGAPTPQTKTAGTALTLSNTIPTKNSTTQNGYTVSFNSNGGSSVSAITATDTVSYQFSSWNTNSGGTGTAYAKGASYTKNENVTLYAQYSSSLSRGSISLPTPTRANYTFAGWSDGSKTYTGSYTPSSNTTLTAVWNINPPQNFAISFIDNTETSIDLALSVGSGIADSTILYYRQKGKATWSQVTGSLSDIIVIEDLLPDTNYEFGMSATNSGYTRYYGNTTSLSSMTYETYSTDMPLPGTPGVGTVEITPFTVTLAGSCYSYPERGFMWSFSKDNGDTWTEYQTSNQYTFTGLSEETSYDFGIKAYPIVEGVNASGQSKAGYRTITTPADQARARIKVNGKWETSKMYIKENGEWKKIKKMYIKKDGQWIRTEN